MTTSGWGRAPAPRLPAPLAWLGAKVCCTLPILHGGLDQNEWRFGVQHRFDLLKNDDKDDEDDEDDEESW